MESVESLEAKVFECELEVLRHAAQGRRVRELMPHFADPTNRLVMDLLWCADFDFLIEKWRTQARHNEEAIGRLSVMKQQIPLSDSIDAVASLESTRRALSEARAAQPHPTEGAQHVP